MLSIALPSAQEIRKRADIRYNGCIKAAEKSFIKERLLNVCEEIETDKNIDKCKLSFLLIDIINILIDD